MPKTAVITIDGPGGSGKGTLSRLLARKLGWHYLDSGAIYRLLGQEVKRSNLSLDDIPTLVDVAANLDIEFRDNDAGDPITLLRGEDVSAELRTEQSGEMASKVAVIPEVREALMQRQRDFRTVPGLVADGRDMGTVVFPDAELKLFLTASLEERVKRRHKQLKEKGFEVSIDGLFHEISARDERDANRSASPLRPADDAIVVDCSDIPINEMVECAMKYVSERDLVV